MADNCQTVRMAVKDKIDYHFPTRLFIVIKSSNIPRPQHRGRDGGTAWVEVITVAVIVGALDSSPSGGALNFSTALPPQSMQALQLAHYLSIYCMLMNQPENSY